jgi:hypothetical protein
MNTQKIKTQIAVKRKIAYCFHYQSLLDIEALMAIPAMPTIISVTTWASAVILMFREWGGIRLLSLAPKIAPRAAKRSRRRIA